MSAGRGIEHSEFNPASDTPTHLLQIWIMPNKLNLIPSYQQIRYDPQEKVGKWKLIVSPDGAQKSAVINQDAQVFSSVLNNNQQVRINYVDRTPGECLQLR